MIFRLLLLLPVLLLFPACGKTEQAAADHTELETPAGEAVLRHVLGICPHRPVAKQLVLVMGEKMEAASKPFEQKFSDTGLVVTPYNRMEAGMANGQVRTYDSVTQEPVIVLQLSSLTANASSFDAVAAWSWKAEAKRYHFTATPRPDGTFEVRQGEEIPVAARNQNDIQQTK